MASKFLASLTDQQYKDLTNKLFNIQNGICYICQQTIDLQIQNTNIDHIIPLANKGKDSEDNFAITHETCNKSKQDANLTIARVLHKLKHIQEDINSKETRAASLKDILKYYGGSKFDF